MENESNQIDIEKLNKFLNDEVVEDCDFTKDFSYEELYKTIYEESFSKLKDEFKIIDFVNLVGDIYIKQNKLNHMLKITTGDIDIYDEFLFNCVMYELCKRCPKSMELKKITKDDFFNMTREYIEKKLQETKKSDSKVRIKSFLSKLK